MGRPIRDIAFWDGSGQGTGIGGLAATMRVATPRGLTPVAALRPGDLILTRDSGYRNVTAARMAYAKYVYWFLQGNSINAGREGAAERILAYCRRFGWEI